MDKIIPRVKRLIASLRPKKSNNFELIRLGPNRDGGYLVPDDLHGISTLFSPGVAYATDFEKDCINRGMNVYMADYSVEEAAIKLQGNSHSFIKKFIGCYDNEMFITLDTWVNGIVDLQKSNDMMLQMDIEGYEFEAIINMSQALLNKFRIIVVEFHRLHRLWDTDYLRIAESVFTKLLLSHECVHIHPNNCCGISSEKGIDIPRIAEFTFLRKDRFQGETDHVTRFPHPLDYDNTSNSSIVLPPSWYDDSI